MTRLITLTLLLSLTLAGTANAHRPKHPPVHPPQINCTWHPELCNPDLPVTPATFQQATRILACADRPVLRVADMTMGIAVDLDLETFNSGVYGAAKFTIARYYAGVGATCEKLGGSSSGKFLDGYAYPIWTR